MAYPFQSQSSPRIVRAGHTAGTERTAEVLSLSISSMAIGHRRQGSASHPAPPESRYVFYRLYSPSIALGSRNAFDLTDPFLGRIKMISVPPPRTIDTLQRCLAHTEHLNDPTNQRTELYATTSSDSPIQNGNVPIDGASLGLSPDSPVALVLRQELSEAEKVERAKAGEWRDVPDDIRMSPVVLEGRRRSQEPPSYEIALPCATAFDAQDSFLGRLDVTRVPPPHTVATLSRSLACVENITRHHASTPLMFSSAAEQAPMSATERISLGAVGGSPGFVPEKPLSLMLRAYPGKRPQRGRAGSISTPSARGDVAPPSAEYLYYRLYTPTGETSSRTAFHPLDHALGRIPRAHVPPPHTSAAIRRCIAKAEENARYICGALYSDNSGQSSPIPDNAHVVLLSLEPSRSSRILGSSPMTPVVLVQQERREGLFNRPAKCMVSSSSSARAVNSPGWLNCARGLVVLTDGVLKDVGSSNVPIPAYMAVTANGQKGFILPGNFQFLDELLPDGRRVLQA